MNLVTGATGHIGNVLIRKLLALGKHVRALVFPSEDLSPLDGLDAELVEGDILDYPSLEAAFRGIQTAYHLAGVITIMPGRNELVRLVNVLGTRNVLHAARAAGVRRVIYTSSIHALTRIPHGLTIDETIPFDPEHAISIYDYSKALASQEVQQACQSGLDAVIACPTGVIGPYDFRVSEMGQIILDCIRRKPQFYVDGAYDFVDVRDVADGLILLSTRGRTGQTYILSGEALSVKSLMDNVREISGGRFLQIKIPMPLAELAAKFSPFYYHLARIKPRLTPYALATITSNPMISHEKAERELGYHPRSIFQSIQDAVYWFLQTRQRTQRPEAMV